MGWDCWEESSEGNEVDSEDLAETFGAAVWLF